jgi:hypothetical protein
VRTVMKMSPVVFRETYDGTGMLQYFRGELVLPYAEVLRSFKPAVTSPGWITRQRNHEKKIRCH